MGVRIGISSDGNFAIAAYVGNTVCVIIAIVYHLIDLIDSLFGCLQLEIATTVAYIFLC